ncbi:metallophosphoesterase [Niallia taxi]|uniref:metallophosphoesterase n=1 Tax=Niallia taxi TaxID=2499688 RepID=UPI002550744F|nr:metallophosphoesterase [Niallia taxi]MDK8640130.1 metallophosphoesterase [Niallia taxi]MED4039022.1 metallophosphoesterase [Niallia taxi]
MKKKILFIITLLLLCAVVFSYFQNNWLSISRFTITSHEITGDGLKIIQLSDLHSKEFGENQHRLVTKVQALSPDIIAFTGDIIDKDKYDEKTVLSLLKQLKEIAPTYYVTGNHEYWSGKYDQLEKIIKSTGVTILHNQREKLQLNGTTFLLAGIDDPAISNEASAVTVETELAKTLEGVNDQDFVVLLSHRPELFSIYAEHNIDLVLSGHAHGGQVRLPFVGGLVAPDQGFLPMYTAGKYEQDDTAMIVNRGLGNSIIPQRVFNTPEIVEITIKGKK